MALSNFTELSDAIEEFLMRSDFTATIPILIRLAEADLNRRLRTRHQVVRSRIVLQDRYTELPNGWRESISIQRVNDDYPLDFLEHAAMDRFRFQISEGTTTAPSEAVFFTLFGNTIELAPSPSVAKPLELELTYWEDIPPLTGAAPVNWLITQHPDLYLFGALTSSAPLLKEDERIAVWKGLYDQALLEANAEDERSKHSGAPLRRPIFGFKE